MTCFWEEWRGINQVLRGVAGVRKGKGMAAWVLELWVNVSMKYHGNRKGRLWKAICTQKDMDSLSMQESQERASVVLGRAAMNNEQGNCVLWFDPCSTQGSSPVCIVCNKLASKYCFFFFFFYWFLFSFSFLLKFCISLPILYMQLWCSL